MAAAATVDDEIIPQEGSHVASEIWKWFGFARADMEQHTRLGSKANASEEG